VTGMEGRPAWWTSRVGEREVLLSLAATPGPLPAAVATRLAEGRDPASLLRAHSPEPVAAAARLDALGVRLMVPGDQGWPLDATPPDPACAWLFVAGPAPPPAMASVAVVGGRRASPLRRAAARSIGAGLARAGWCVVSGGAPFSSQWLCCSIGCCPMPTTTERPRWSVFFYDLDRVWPDLADPVSYRFADLPRWIRSHGGVTGQPFLLGPDGRPDLRVNAFFSAPQTRALDPDTWRKYAYTLGLWLNFLESRAMSWDRATPEDVEAFKVWRLADARNTDRVKAGTFGDNRSALNTFYGWAARMHGVHTPILPEASRPSAVRGQDVKWFDPPGYRRWRDVGLRGFGLDGLEDPQWRGRNEQRDAAFADGLYETGLRLQEWASILDLELPPDNPARGYSTCRLAAECGKGRRGRQFWLSRTALTGVLAYGEGARALAVHRAQRDGRYRQLTGVLVLERVQANGRVELRRGDGELETVPLDTLTPARRRRLFRRVDGELVPLAVWLNGDGLPRASHGWQHTFTTANKRIERLGLAGFRCTPHMLRHSFALKWYSIGKLLYEARFGHLSEEELRDFRAQFGDTWPLVQLMLGHRDPRTTMNTYLEPFRALDVELLLEHAAGVRVAEVLAALYRDHPRVHSDPLDSGS